MATTPTSPATIQTRVPGADRTRQRIQEHERRARDDQALVGRIIDIISANRHLDDPDNLLRLARILERNAGFHARMATHLTGNLAEGGTAQSSQN
jgi:hypothetical protein